MNEENKKGPMSMKDMKKNWFYLLENIITIAHPLWGSNP